MREPGNHPVDTLEWIDPTTLSANDYNPNRGDRLSKVLLAKSIIETGWTQPIVVCRQAEGLVIVDGFHRWGTAMSHLELSGPVPVVYIDDDSSEAGRMKATVNHNRSRGTHLVEFLGPLAERFVDAGGELEEIGMTASDFRLLTGKVAEETAAPTYSEAWEPHE